MTYFADADAKLAELEQRIAALETSAPPPAGVLRYKPPALTSPQTIVVTAPGTVNMGTGDYIVDISSVAWSSQASGRSAITLSGGRNVVLIGGAITMTSTNATDDATALLIDGGVAGGVVHLEGLDVKACNGITVRTPRRVNIQNCRFEVRAYQDQHGNIHPDIVQVWGTSTSQQCAGIYMHKVTGYTTYTGLVCLVEVANADPVIWERWDVDLHPAVNANGTKDAGNYAYMSSGPNANGTYTEYRGEVYAELPTGGAGAYTRKIDDIVITKVASPLSCHPYEIRSPDGTALYTSPTNPSGGNAPYAVGTQAGNYLTFARIPKFAAHKWIIGKPPGGDFCPAGVPGANYVSPGYL